MAYAQIVLTILKVSDKLLRLFERNSNINDGKRQQREENIVAYEEKIKQIRRIKSRSNSTNRLLTRQEDDTD